MRPCGSQRVSRQPGNIPRAWCFWSNCFEGTSYLFFPLLPDRHMHHPSTKLPWRSLHVRLIAKSAHSHPAEQNTTSSQKCVLIRLEEIKPSKQVYAHHLLGSHCLTRPIFQQPVSKESSDLLEWPRNSRSMRVSVVLARWSNVARAFTGWCGSHCGLTMPDHEREGFVPVKRRRSFEGL
ncbi:hypothetical protein BDD12DRAFT_46719 [Trichophaea hybrida]|nr:hypothetical protein BDD12DRAFT_46719 [Trichophaea hybrida]